MFLVIVPLNPKCEQISCLWREPLTGFVTDFQFYWPDVERNGHC